jgi:hypothetical protein
MRDAEDDRGITHAEAASHELVGEVPQRSRRLRLQAIGVGAKSADCIHVAAKIARKMGEKNNDGGQFFTPRQVIRAMVRLIDPRVGETVYDPGCGTGGFLAQAFDHMRAGLGDGATAEQLRVLREETFWGREKADLIYPIALANLVLHGIDQPHIWHGNTLTRQEVYGGLFVGAPDSRTRRAPPRCSSSST